MGLPNRGSLVPPTHDAWESMPAEGRPRMRLAHVTTIPATLRFFDGQPGYMRERGIDEIAISSPGPELERFARSQGVRCFAVPMERGIAPVRDLAALVRLWALLRRLDPDIVDAHTPKGALLGILAGYLARVPVRIHHLHGLRFVTTHGIRRQVLRATERVTSLFATRVLCVSRSVAALAVEERLAPADKVAVLADGSINGVDASRFHPPSAEERRGAREALGIAPDALVVGYVGRRAREKGLVELTSAWRALREEFPALRLLIVGAPEPTDDIPEELATALRDDARVHSFDFDPETPKYYRAMDVLAFPTYREGFGVIALEAAATGLPVVATRIPGCIDAVQDGVTGTLVPPRDARALAGALREYLQRPALRRSHGAAGRERAMSGFEPRRIWAALYAEYVSLAARHAR